MPSPYLQSGDYAAYGLASSTAASDVAAASNLIDAFLQRPEGVLWTADGNGLPCFMSRADVAYSLTAPGAIAAGSNVVVPVTMGMVTPDTVGEVLILDRATPAKTEACVVSAIGAGSITLKSVGFSHNAGAILEAGLVILEERALPANRAVTRVSRGPVARMIALDGRYAYGRRSQQQAGVFAEPSILASVQALGAPPVWYPVDVNNVSISQSSGEVWVPPGILIANFSDVRMRYVAGWPSTGVPDKIKAACAAVVLQLQETPELTGSIKSYAAGGTKIERFADSQLDASTRASLLKFQAQNWF